MNIAKTIEQFRSYIKTKGITPYAVQRFRAIVLDYYRENGRKLPWRTTADPYRILVSEIMLQQTQVERVIEKYAEFLKAFPTFKALASAEDKSVLKVWQGLGYNRRGLNLKKAAVQIVEEYDGTLPQDQNELEKLAGIGPATAAAICAYAFRQPVVYIETNIRSIFIHMFLVKNDDPKDEDILPLVQRTVYKKDPHTWYNALMDFGVLLKQLVPNPSRKSPHYTRQSKFQGSNRQLRGKILKELLKGESVSGKQLQDILCEKEKRFTRAIDQLVKEGLVKEKAGKYSI